MLPFLEHLEESVADAKKKSGFRLSEWLLVIGGVVMLFVGFLFFPPTVSGALGIALFLSPLWLSAVVAWGAWHLWVIMRQSEYINKQEYILLEIRPPRSIEKTPLAMEAFFSGLHHSPNEGTWYKKYWLGQLRPWWSLEIASIEGQVHFFIWTRAGFRRQIESQVYAQYPGAQVVEVDDYSRTITAVPGDFEIWGCDFVSTNKDPYPIKTYIDYGLDKVQKEPEQVDPLANLIEFMGSMGKGEYLWLQLIIRAHKGEKYHRLTKDGKPYTWRNEAAELVDDIRQKTRQPYTDPSTGEERPGFPSPTKGQADAIAAIERNTSKQAFDVGARGIYLAQAGRFDPIAIAGLTGIFKQFSSEGYNGFKPAHFMTEFDDYPWEMRVEERKNKTRRHLVEAYRRRQYFFEPFAMPDPMVMSTEELATIYHIPSHAVQTPTLPRIQSATGEAPSNLPV
jgi:hypothetical protein